MTARFLVSCFISALSVTVRQSSGQEAKWLDSAQLTLQSWAGGSVDCDPGGLWFQSPGKTIVTNVTGLRYVFQNGTLHFPAFDWSNYRREIHTTSYHCSLQNMAGGHQLLKDVIVNAVGGERVSLEDRFASQVLSPSARLSLSCGARGGARIAWQRDGSPVSSAIVTAALSPGGLLVSTLNFTRISPDEAGLYSCIAYSPGNTTKAEHSARVDVYGPPYIRPMAPVKALVGSKVIVDCPYYGYPISKIQWDHNGKSAVSDYGVRYKRNNEINGYDPKINHINLTEFEMGVDTYAKRDRTKRSFTANEEGTLVIEEVVPEDGDGLYTCSVSNPSGEMARRAFELIVMEPPVIDEFGFGSNLQEGQIAQTTCSVRSGDTPIFFSWLKDGAPIPTSLKAEERSMELFSVLLIKKVKLEHCGTYTCVASNRAARVNQSAELFIKVSPKWLEEPQNSSAVMGRPGRVACSASGYPQPQVHWIKKDETTGSWRPVLEMRGGGPLSLPNGSLVIEAVSSEDGGLYSCRVENGVGQPLSKNIWITVNRPVTFETTRTNITTRINHPASVTCEAFGDHPIRITWTHNGRSVDFLSNRLKVSGHQTERGSISEILLGISAPSDAGEYVCRASNPHGAAQQTIYMTVQEPPGFPLEVSVESVRGRSARVGWRAPAGAAPPRYLLQYQTHHHLSQPHWTSAFTINVSSINSQHRQHAELIGLKPATPYAARLCSVGEMDASPFTRPLLFTTLEEAPSSPPAGVQAEVGPRPGELQVSWIPPPAESLNGLLLGYVIKAVPQINLHAEDNTRILKVSLHSLASPGGVTPLQAVVTGLLKSTRYLLTVSCFNGAGDGPPSPPLYQDTAEGVPEVAPEALDCSAVSPTSLRVSWSPLPPHLQGGAMLGYTVLYTTIDGVQRNISSSHSEVYLQGLSKFADYSVEVAGYCGRGLGPLSAPRSCTTLEDLPSAPAEVKALVVTSTSILVSWLPPLHPNGKLLHYTLFVKPAVGGGTVQSYRVSAAHQEKGVAGSIGGEAREWSASGGVSHVVRGLSQSRRYEAWVTADTKAGEGEPSRRVAAEPTDRVVAGVSSLGGSVWALAGSSPLLWCRALGSPQPRTVWYHRRKVITHHTRFTLNADDSLLIHNIDTSLEGNFTCSAKNLFGSDSVTYMMTVVSPPNSPAVRILPARRGLLLEWTKPVRLMQPTNRTSVILGYTITWRSAEAGGRWESMEIAGGGPGSRLIGGLSCGALYEVRLVATAAVGVSAPAIAHAKTLGGVMTAPSGTDWMWSNSSHISLQMDSWEDGDCGPPHFSVEYRPLTTKQWLKANSLDEEGGRRMLLTGLRPARWYQLRVTAVNEAGPATAVFTISTKTLNGEEIGPLSEPLDTSVLVMVCSCILLLLCMLICLFAAIQKHRHKLLCGSIAGTVSNGGGCKGGLPPVPDGAPPPPCQRIYSSPVCGRKNSKASTEMFEISPYAQFTMGFQTFGHAENQDRPGYVKAKQGIYSTGDTSFQVCSDSDESDSLPKPSTMVKNPNKMCRVQYHR